MINVLDNKGETIPLLDSERETLRDVNERVSKLRRNEKANWTQRAKVKHVQEGGNNTNTFILLLMGYT
jgi:hypothetical protein